MILSNNQINTIRKKAIEFTSNEIHFFNSIEYLIPQFGYEVQLNELFVEKKYLGSYLTCNKPKSIFSYLQKWLRKPKALLGVILADYGMGKTVTTLKLAQNLLNSEKFPLPIYLDLRLITNKNNLDTLSYQSIIDYLLKGSGNFERENPISAEEIIYLVQHDRALIIFDGLDEVLVHLNRKQGKAFVQNLLGIVFSAHQKFLSTHGRALLTCRTHFFRNHEEQGVFLLPDHLKTLKESVHYTFFKLSALTLPQIKNYLIHLVPDEDIDVLLSLVRSVNNLVEISKRPYTLSLIPHLIPHIKEWNQSQSKIQGITIYRHLILSLLERDTGKHKLSVEHKLILLENFSADLWRSGKQAWTSDYLEKWFKQWIVENNDLAIHYGINNRENNTNSIVEILLDDLMVATLLVRVKDSNFRFAHTSILEFFLASYLYKSLIENNLKKWILPIISRETFDFLGQWIVDEDNPQALISLRSILNNYINQASELAFAYCLNAHIKFYPYPNTEYIHMDGAQLKDWVIMSKDDINIFNLRGASFKSANLNGTIIRQIFLNEANFSNASCEAAEIASCMAQKVKFCDANLMHGYFIDVNLEGSDFSHTNLHYREFTRCGLENTIALEPSIVHSSIIFDQCTPSSTYDDNRHLIESTLNLPHHLRLIVSCSSSPCDNYVSSCSLDNTLRIWNINELSCIKILVHSHLVYDSTFSQDNEHILSTTSDSNLYLWHIKSGKCIQTIKGHTKGIRGCDYSFDGKYFISCSDDLTARVWDSETLECIHVLRGHKGAIRDCKFSPVGYQFLTCSDDETVRIWNAKNGECLQTLKGHKGIIRDGTFSIDGRLVISASADKTLRVWNAQTGQCLNVLRGHTDKVRACDVSPNGQYIASVAFDQTIRIWKIDSNKCIKILTGHHNKIRGCIFLKNGTLVTASDDLTLKLWNIESGICSGTLGNTE
ncbi:MAG: pentapeptide repeat-containing protein [Pseudomonadota bacterium]